MLQLNITNPQILSKICHALSTELRLKIVELLQRDTLDCLEIAGRLGYPLSTIGTNVRVLEEAGLVRTELLAAKNGLKKRCSLVYLDVFIQLTTGLLIPQDTKFYEISVPIGNYMDCKVLPSCGFVGRKMKEGFQKDAHFDDPNYFLHPSRMDAQLIWFRDGYVEYRLPVYGGGDMAPTSLSFSMELCSEAPGFNNKWKSDITVWVNGVDIGTWTSPADFGDRRGKLTPMEWGLGNTQYGLLTNWHITEEGAFFNDSRLSTVRLSQLQLSNNPYVTLRLGIKPDAEHVGGINIFGKHFGDYEQEIKMQIRY